MAVFQGPQLVGISYASAHYIHRNLFHYGHNSFCAPHPDPEAAHWVSQACTSPPYAQCTPSLHCHCLEEPQSGKLCRRGVRGQAELEINSSPAMPLGLSQSDKSHPGKHGYKSSSGREVSDQRLQKPLSTHLFHRHHDGPNLMGWDLLYLL